MCCAVALKLVCCSLFSWHELHHRRSFLCSHILVFDGPIAIANSAVMWWVMADVCDLWCTSLTVNWRMQKKINNRLEIGCFEPYDWQWKMLPQTLRTHPYFRCCNVTNANVHQMEFQKQNKISAQQVCLVIGNVNLNIEYRSSSTWIGCSLWRISRVYFMR